MGRRHYKGNQPSKSVGGPGVPAGYQRVGKASQMLDLPVSLIVKGLHERHIKKKIVAGNCYCCVDDVIKFAERGVSLGLFPKLSEKAQNMKAMNEAFPHG